MFVTVKRQELIDILKVNMAEHRGVFEKAVEKYRQQSIKLLDGYIAQLKAGKSPHIRVSMPVPRDYTNEYKKALRMLELHQEDTLELSEDDVQCYVMDEWGWKREWETTTSGYLKG